MSKATLIMMIGLPASGKTTIRKYINLRNKYTVLSVDDFLESQAKLHRISFKEAVVKFSDEANRLLNEQIEYCAGRNKNVIIDMLNLNSQARKSIIKKFPRASYKVVAIYLDEKLDDLLVRNEIRKQKSRNHSEDTIKDMFKKVQKPDLKDFDVILKVESGLMTDEDKQELDYLR